MADSYDDSSGYIIEYDDLIPSDYVLDEDSVLLEEDPINTAKQVYRVFCDGYEILDYSNQDLFLLNPKVELEINTAGSFEFTMPPSHIYYDIIRPLVSTIEVYEDETLIWFGRPVEISIDFYKQKKVYCEGPLSFFNDSVQMPNEFENYPLHDFFNQVISTHNWQMSSKTRQFSVGNVTVDDKLVYRKLNYESTYDVLTGMCLDAEDGYFFFRKENGIIYIDWLKELPYSCNQPIQFALNLLDYNSNFDGKDFATCVLPVGATNSDTNAALTISSINNGSDILQSEAVTTYGNIVKAQVYSDIEDAYELVTEGRKYLENTQFNSLSIECNAADLHSMNGEYELFRVGYNVHCISTPHLVDRNFPISKMSLELDSALKTITLGIIKKKTLTRIYKRESEPIEQTQPYDDYTPTYDPDVFPDENGDPWVLVPPEEPGGPVTAVKMPTHITIARNPNKMDYKNGEEIDFTGLLVNIWCNDKIWTNPPRYVDGRAPMAELSFSSKKATLMPVVTEMDQTIVITWTYKGKEYKTKLVIHVTSGNDGISDLRNWTKIAMANFSVSSDTVSGTMVAGQFEKLVYNCSVKPNHNYVFSFGVVGNFTTNNRPNTNSWAAACTSIPRQDFLESQSSICLAKTAISPSAHNYTISFNSGSNSSVYLVLDYAAVTDGEGVTFHYSNIQLYEN